MKPHILLVDDENDALFSMKVALEAPDQKVTGVSDGYSALNIIKTKEKTADQIALLITDICMPSMNGMELIDKVKKLRPGFPIIAVTGMGDKKMLVELIRKGVDEFIDKPFSPQNIRERVKRTLSLANKRIEHEKKLINITKKENPVLVNTNGLPGREEFYRQLYLTANQHKCNKHKLAVFCISIDRFEKVKSFFGHSIGDKLFNSVGERIVKCLRDHDIVAQTCSNEFAILAPQIEKQDNAISVTKRILQNFEQPIFLQGFEHFVTLSIGISIYPDDGEKPETLMNYAYSAMERAHRLGGNNYQVHKMDMNSRSLEAFKLENKLRKAQKQNEFVLHYQPLIDLRTGNISGIEALLRWDSPELGLVSPADFIPIAEETGLILPIGKWVLYTACRQNRVFQKKGFPPIRVAVNLSARQFQESNLLETITQALTDSGLDPDFLELELTESTVMNNAEETINTLNKIKSLGVRLSIDDFGTGYSSLSYLKRFPIDTLKIDRSFVNDLSNNASDTKIIKAIIEMGHSLGFKIVAEGVEKADQAAFLMKNKCDYIQGFYFSRPVPENKITELFIKKQRMNLKSFSVESS